MLLRNTLLFLSKRRELEALLSNNPLARQARVQFIAGENREEALAVARRLNEDGFKITLDYLCEPLREEEQARLVAREYMEALRDISERGLDAGISVKLSNLGLKIDRELAAAHLLTVAQTAARHKRFVRIDMEEAESVEETLAAVLKVHNEARHVGTVIQSYLRRSSADIEILNTNKVPVRLVRGFGLPAGKDAFRTREETDLYFMRMIEALMREGNHPAIATHDEKLIEYAIDMAFIFGLNQREYEFQMLYGFRCDLQEKLRDQGYRVRIYLPYGKAWFGYFLRRLAERPAALWFLMKTLRRPSP